MNTKIKTQILLVILITTVVSACTINDPDQGTSTTLSSPPPSASDPVLIPIEPTLNVLPTATTSGTPTPTAVPVSPQEAPVHLIPLEGALSSPKAEVSGMTWYGDLLLILPQYPEKYLSPSGSPSLFALTRSEINDFLDGSSSDPLETRLIPIGGTQGTSQIPGYEGFEAIATDGESVYLSIEANDRGAMHGYLIRGLIAVDGSAIDLDPGSLTEIPTPVQIFNAAYETLIASGDQILVLFEANGQDLNPGPSVLQYDSHYSSFAELDFDNIEYRITDSTALDVDDKLWVLNVFMPIEFWYYTNSDPISEKYGIGNTHSINNHVERLLELKYNKGHITLSGEPPLYLELIDDTNSRNWEAIVRLDERGFLAMTDTYPGTILGFIPFPGK